MSGNEGQATKRRAYTVSSRQHVANDFVSQCMAEMRRKGAEYAVDGDPNGNFYRVAEETGQTHLQVWHSHFAKHMDAIRNYVKDPSRQMAEPLEGRIVDAVNYLILLATMELGNNDETKH